MKSKSMDENSLDYIKEANVLKSNKHIFNAIKEKATCMIPSEYIFGYLKCNVSKNFKPLTIEKLNKICEEFHSENFNNTVKDFQCEGVCKNTINIYNEFRQRPQNCRSLMDMTIELIKPKENSLIERMQINDTNSVKSLLLEIQKGKEI